MNWRFEEYETLGSTSDLCKARADDGEETGLVVLARRQFAGRGTRGRVWVDPGGNLAVSLLLRVSSASAQDLMTALPFMVGLALYDAVSDIARDAIHRFSLKWPNDLLLDERKLAGILIESGSGGENRWIVVGIGVNLAVAPTVEGRVLAALSEVAIPPDPMDVARRIVHHLDLWLERRNDGGFDVVRRAWLARAHPVGRHLAVRAGETYITGIFSGLDEQGRLLLELQNGEIRPVVTGDIFLG